MPVSAIVYVLLHLCGVGRSSVQILWPNQKIATAQSQQHCLESISALNKENKQINKVSPQALGLPAQGCSSLASQCPRCCKPCLAPTSLQNYLAHRAYTQVTFIQDHVRCSKREKDHIKEAGEPWHGLVAGSIIP